MDRRNRYAESLGGRAAAGVPRRRLAGVVLQQDEKEFTLAMIAQTSIGAAPITLERIGGDKLSDERRHRTCSAAKQEVAIGQSSRQASLSPDAARLSPRHCAY
jgi:hypothetical protein